MYSEEQKQTIKATIVRKLINGKSLNQIIKKGKKPNAKVKMPGRTTIYKWLNPNHEEYDADFFNEYNKITIWQNINNLNIVNQIQRVHVPHHTMIIEY